MATGTAIRLHRCGFSKILMTETANPLAVRRTVSFCEAVHDGSQSVEGVQALRIGRPEDAPDLWTDRVVPILVDPGNSAKYVLKPDVVIDAILAKANVGTRVDDAPLVIGFGPGFCASKDVHYVIETNRGHNLGRVIADGSAEPDTGTPGEIQGETVRRVLRARADGVFRSVRTIGEMVRAGETVAEVSGISVKAELNGVLRGLMRPNTYVTQRLKVGDIDPRGDPSYCYTISDKTRSVAGGALEAIMMRFNTD